MACEEVRQLLEQGLLDQARTQLERQIHGGELPKQELGEAYSLAALVHLRRGDYYAAARCGESGLRLAEETGNTALAVMAHFRLGTALTYLGDTPEAMEHLRHFLVQASASWEECRPLVPRARFNLGINLMRRREYATALQEYRQASDEFEAAGAPDLAARSWREAAWCLMLLDRADEALPWLERMEQYTRACPEDSHVRNVLVVDRALYHRQKRNIAASMALCEDIFQPGRTGVTPEHLAEAAWVAGLNALDLGHLDQAGLFAAAALDHALRAKWPFMINQATALRRRIDETRHTIGV